MKAAIGIDIGGTKISMVIGSANGRILGHRVIPTQTGRGMRACVNDLAQNLKDMIRLSGLSRRDLLGIGVGIPGPVDSRRGIVPCSPHLAGWAGLPLAAILRRKTGLPVVMANDANAAAVGEKIFGGGKKIENFIYMTVSTGIGGGLVIHNRLVEGAGWAAGEVGHMTLVPDGERCKCGKKGCLEAYASGTAIARMAREARKRRGRSLIYKLAAGRPVTARFVGAASKRRDALALEIYRTAGDYLGVGIANLLNVLNPQKVILGGGVFESAPKNFWNAMLRRAKREAWPEAFRSAKIVRSKLARVGDLGALALAFEDLGGRP